MPNLRVGVVGLGYWGPNLLRVLCELPDVDVVAICDRRQNVLDTLAGRYGGIQAVTDFDVFLAAFDLDAVAIATPVSTHYPMAKRALELGKHVFVEKPLAATVVQALGLKELAENAGLTLMSGHTFLYSPPVLAIHDMIRSHELGDINFISTSRVNLGLHQSDVGVVSDLGSHDFSILRYWLDELPTTVTGVARCCVIPEVPDIAFVNLRYTSGAIVHAEFSWLAPSKLRRTTVVGSRKMVVYDDTSTAEPVRVYDTSASFAPPSGSFGEHQLSYRAGDILSPRIDAAQPLALELSDFRDAISEGRPPRSSASVGVDVVRVIEAAEQSIASGGVPVDLIEQPSLTSTLLDAARRF
jgi:predicted dehydrogenase